MPELFITIIIIAAVLRLESLLLRISTLDTWNDRLMFRVLITEDIQIPLPDHKGVTPESVSIRLRTLTSVVRFHRCFLIH